MTRYNTILYMSSANMFTLLLFEIHVTTSLMYVINNGTPKTDLWGPLDAMRRLGEPTPSTHTH